MKKRWKRIAVSLAVLLATWAIVVAFYDREVIENDYEIARTPEDVYDFMIDMRNEAKWNPELISMEKANDTPPGAGSQFRAQWKGSPVILVTCMRAERARHITFDNGGPFEVNLDVSLSPGGPGTKVHTRMDVHPTGAARLIFPIFAQMVKRQEKSVPQNLTRVLEQEGRSSSAPSAEHR